MTSILRQKSNWTPSSATLETYHSMWGATIQQRITQIA